MSATPTPWAAATDAAETIGGKVYGRSTLHDSTGADAMGLVAASPASNTILGRLKALIDLFTTNSASTATSAPADDVFSITPSDSVALATVPKALLCTVAGNVAVRGTGASPVTIPMTAGQILPVRARYVYAAGTTGTVVGLA